MQVLTIYIIYYIPILYIIYILCIYILKNFFVSCKRTEACDKYLLLFCVNHKILNLPEKDRKFSNSKLYILETKRNSNFVFLTTKKCKSGGTWVALSVECLGLGSGQEIEPNIGLQVQWRGVCLGFSLPPLTVPHAFTCSPLSIQ